MKQHKVCIITSRDENGWTRDATLYLDGKQWRKDEWTDETQISRMLLEHSKEIMDKVPEIWTGTITTKEIGEAL